MFVHDLYFKIKDDSDRYEYSIDLFLYALSANNQIIFESLNLSGKDGVWVARVTTPFMDSLEDKYYNEEVREAYSKLTDKLLEPVSVKYVGVDQFHSDDLSAPDGAGSYVLCIHPHLRDVSPVCCIDSNKNVPYYLLPQLSESTLKELTAWEVEYAAFNRLLCIGGIGEKSANRMLCNINSKLNQKGLSVCRMLEKELGKPVYYFVSRYYGRHSASCPICGERWRRREGSGITYKCHKCRLVSEMTADEAIKAVL